MDDHSLIELAHMFHRIRSTIVNGERRLMETLRKFSPFYLARERGFKDLIQHLTHNIISHAFARRAFVPSPVVALFVARERFTQWSSRPLPVTSVLLIIRGDVGIGDRLLPLRTT